MILQQLVEYYNRISQDPETSESIPKPGHSLQKVSFCVLLSPEGKLQQFQSLLDEGGKRPLPRQLLLPGQSKPSGSGINPCFLWDNSAYMLGYRRDDPKPDRTLESFEAFRSKHLILETSIQSPAFSAVCAFLRAWSPEQSAQRASELSDITGSFGVFRIAGDRSYVHEDQGVVSWWTSNGLATESALERGICLVTGRDEPIARLHEPKIKGVRDAQTAGALLVSFNLPAFESFGKQQSYNAPVSLGAAFKYANALNYLLDARRRRSESLGDATVVFWAERRNPLEDYMSDLIGEPASPPEDAPPEDKRRAEEIKLFISQLRQGRAETEPPSDDGTRFFVLGLSPNASRISVRFWSESTVGEMKSRLRQHIEDTDLAGARDGDPPLTIRRIVNATGRAEISERGGVKRYITDSVPPLLAGAIARSILTGGPYPQALLTAMVNRLRSDGAISHPRVAAIKACIVRNSRLKGSPKEVSVALDTSRSDPAYVTGRLFALLEKIQTDSADGALNATIKDRYFSAASATPGVVFPRLIRLSQHHLAKLETGRKIFYEKQLGEVVNKLDGFPTHLNLEDQGLFAVGYFHQRQDLYTPKDKKQNEGERE